MTATGRTPPSIQPMVDIVPFESAEAAWFWFIQANQARVDGARIGAGIGQTARPCEPLDIFHVIDRLYRKRVLLIDHFYVLRHYGRRMTPPDPRRVREVRAFRLWSEALGHIEPALVRKGIVAPPVRKPNRQWFLDARVYETRPVA